MSRNDFTPSLPGLPATPRWVQAIANLVDFCLLGLVYASWAARVPTVSDALGLDAAQISISLLAGFTGMTLVTRLVCNRLNDRHGAS